ncbi:MAG: hypothetical protein NZZ41_01390 [Candidatus Dojkabacteria bacterium]|nr:hypothetical protein [Candidatus Dojkabacteria bacterium]
MYKSKDGKIYATLTEIKSKTGDIFTLVDDYGEVILTSYGKTRYKIIKIPIENVEDISNAKFSKGQKSSDLDLQQQDEPAQIVPQVKALSISKKESTPSTDILDSSDKENNGNIDDFVVWDRLNQIEVNYRNKIIKPIV